MEILILVVAMVISGFVGMIIGGFRARQTEGFWFGALLGPFGWIVTALLPEAGRECPECLGTVKQGAKRCKHCGEKLPDDIAKPVANPWMPQPAPAKLVEASPVEFWYLMREDGSEGPYTKEQLKMFVGAGKFDPEHLCARKGDVGWKPISEVISEEIMQA